MTSNGGVGQARGIGDLRVRLTNAVQAIAAEGATAVLLGHLCLCEDEYWRMLRAFDRSRPLQRVYARLRRIVIMLDLGWGCQGDDPDGAVGRAIENLMTWHPTLRKGMRLPLPPEVVYQAALCHLAATAPAPLAAAILKLRDLPLEPVEWQISGDVAVPLRQLRECHAIVCALLGQVVGRLLPSVPDWVHISGEGIFRQMAIENCYIRAANPVTGQWHGFNLAALIHGGRLGVMTDMEALRELEAMCVCPVPRPRVAPPPAHVLPPGIEVGCWISAPALGEVVSIEPGHWNLGRRIGVRVPGGRVIRCMESATRWNLLASAADAADARRLAARIGLFIKAHARALRDGSPVPANLDSSWGFPMPENLDRALAFWVALHLDYILSRSRLGRSIQPGGFIVFRRATAMGAYERNALRVFLLRQTRAELAARRDATGIRLAAALLHVARQARSVPAAWDAPPARQFRDEALRIDRGDRQQWVRSSQHCSVPRVGKPWRYRLASIAEDRPLDRLLIDWLFDLDDLQYRWSGGSQQRLERLAAFWHGYAAHRDRPRLRFRRRAVDRLN